ncbi:carboxypeptidase-like regulatory domain-containing protein, partial [Flagellimonas onchidii]|uniref:carboxypeptidase-like regulatory domain-containing protein n=1 Tax=Flagellimonas onchidii TaxID=2562684 RepID=UPI0014561FA4
DQLHDGYIFFQRATLPKHRVIMDSLAISEKQLGFGKKIGQIGKGQKTIIKGQVIDQTNNAPVPFATLILKNEEIYRVADKNGYYQLPVDKRIEQGSSVEISSLGFETSQVLFKKLNIKTYLKPKFEELKEVVVTGYLSPATVLKKAISRKKTNHPIEPFNFYRYGRVLVNKNDRDELDLELITKDYDQGYLSPYVITQRVEQIKWNKNNNPKKYKYSSQFFSYRQNAIRYANILHKRKYKKFKLEFIGSNNEVEDGLYVISFQTERNKWSYTNRGYPTKYFGRVYIDKVNFAIVKVVENWETLLREEEIEKHLKRHGHHYQNIVQTTIKEENICYFEDILNDGKYYATRYFNRSYDETIDKDNKRENGVLEMDSHLFDFQLKDIEEIEYEFSEKEHTVLNRVEFDKTYWDSFLKQFAQKQKQ